MFLYVYFHILLVIDFYFFMGHINMFTLSDFAYKENKTKFNFFQIIFLAIAHQ